MLTDAYRQFDEQYACEAAFLWELRSIAVDQPHYKIEDINELEQRIEAQLDGLMLLPEQAWDICQEALEQEAPGDVFAAAIIAFRSLESKKIQRVVEAGLFNSETFKGLAFALQWLPGELCHSWIKKFFTSKDLEHKYLAITACSLRQEDPHKLLTNILQRQDCLAHEKLAASALRLVGQLKRHDLAPLLKQALIANNPSATFWATWSAVLLGDQQQASELRAFVFEDNPLQQQAIELAFRSLPIDQARSWVSELAKNKQPRQVIQATAVLGDPHAVTWLIGQMQQPALARLAAEAFTQITGIDLRQHQLINDVPDLTEQIPNDDPDDSSVAMDEDENLAWPDSEKIAATWQEYGSRFQPGVRHFMGRPINLDTVKTTLNRGYQRQRHAAALELALLEPSQILLNTRARTQGPL